MIDDDEGELVPIGEFLPKLEQQYRREVFGLAPKDLTRAAGPKRAVYDEASYDPEKLATLFTPFFESERATEDIARSYASRLSERERATVVVETITRIGIDLAQRQQHARRHLDEVAVRDYDTAMALFRRKLVDARRVAKETTR